MTMAGVLTEDMTEICIISATNGNKSVLTCNTACIMQLVEAISLLDEMLRTRYFRKACPGLRQIRS